MVDDNYKMSFIIAITLHALLLFSLLVKFTSSKSKSFSFGPAVINAVAVSESDIIKKVNKPASAPPVLQKQSSEKPSSVVSNKKFQTNEKLNKALQKSLLAEQEKEIANLKKERQDHKKDIAKEQQQRMQKLLQNQAIAEQKQLAEEQQLAQAAQMQGEINMYNAMIIQAISSQWVIPDGIDPRATCQLLISLAPGGMVIDVKLLSSSGNQVLDRSAQAAVWKASPLPVSEDERIFDSSIKLKFNPEGIMGD